MLVELIVTFSVIISCLVLYFLSCEDRIKKYVKDIPGPKPLLLIGNALDFKNYYVVLDVYKSYFQKYGPFIKMQIGPNRVIVSSMEHSFFEFILSSTKVIEKSIDYHFFHNWLGTGLLTSGGQKWKKRRRAITPAFHFKIMEQFISSFDSASNILVQKLEKEVGNPSVDIYDYVNLLTLDIICESTMGTSVDAQKKADNKYVNYVREMGQIIYRRIISPIMMYDTLYPLAPDYYKEKKAVNYLHRYTDSVIDKRKELLKNQPPIIVDDDNQDFGGRPRIAFLDLLLQTQIDGKPLSREDIREEVDTFMFEGHDTTGSGISFTLYSLSQHQEVQEKVFKEQIEVLKGDLKKSANYTDLLNMKYLELVIKESLRLYPPVPMIGRKLTEDIEYGGRVLPKGLDIALVIFHIHRNEKYFKDPEKFIPERFEDPEFRKDSNFVYVPFSAGPRNCIGQKFALFEMKSTISKVIRNFRLLPTPPSDAPILSPETILKSLNGIRIRLEKRSLRLESKASTETVLQKGSGIIVKP